MMLVGGYRANGLQCCVLWSELNREMEREFSHKIETEMADVAC
jgi:hypothetical protein